MKYPPIIRTWLWMICLLSSLSSAVCSNLGTSPDFTEGFSAANRLFEQANAKALENPAQAQDLYQESILKYQLLTEQTKVRSPELYTNLGNAYFFAGDHGRAVLSYQRALSLDPLQNNALHNLRYARSLTIDELPISRTQQVIDALSFWHRWPFVLRLGIFVIANTVLWIALAMLLYRRARWHYGSIAGAATITLIFALSLITSEQRWDNAVDAVVVEREVIARQGNGYIYDNAFTSPLHAGTEFTIIERRNDWYHAQLLDGSTCWLPEESVETIRQSP